MRARSEFYPRSMVRINLQCVVRALIPSSEIVLHLVDKIPIKKRTKKEKRKKKKINKRKEESKRETNIPAQKYNC